MLLEVMDSMFKPYKFHKVPGSVLVSCCLRGVLARLNVARCPRWPPLTWPAPGLRGHTCLHGRPRAPLTNLIATSLTFQVFYGSYSYVFTLVMPNSIFIYWGWPEQAAQ